MCMTFANILKKFMDSGCPSMTPWIALDFRFRTMGMDISVYHFLNSQEEFWTKGNRERDEKEELQQEDEGQYIFKHLVLKMALRMNWLLEAQVENIFVVSENSTKQHFTGESWLGYKLYETYILGNECKLAFLRDRKQGAFVVEARGHNSRFRKCWDQLDWWVDGDYNKKCKMCANGFKRLWVDCSLKFYPAS